MVFKRPKNWKLVKEMKATRFFSIVDTQNFSIGLITGCILVSLTYYTISRTDMISNSILNSQTVPSSRNTTSVIPIAENVTQQMGALRKSTKNCSFGDADSEFCEKTKDTEVLENFSDKEKSSTISEKTDEQNEGISSNLILNTNSSKTSEEIQVPVINNSGSMQDERKPLCDFSEHRSAICDLEGDIRIIGKNLSSVILVDPSQSDSSTSRNESWEVKPYARKWDGGAMKKVKIVNVKALDPNSEEAPKCSVNHSVPAIIFSIAGYTGNYFHDTTDVLVPLFQTAREFNGQVQFLVTDYKAWWIGKHSAYLKRLSVYEVIDYDTEDQVHCFKHVIVGLRSDNDLTIDPLKSKNGYSMTDFMKFMRESYGLKRDNALKLDENTSTRPRLLLIARGRTRKFTNVDMIADMAEKVGFEVVVAEANFNKVSDFSRIVNSCDVLMGVHGAGLTNIVFLPMNAILIQVVPFGVPDWISKSYFGEPSKHMNLKYIEYGINVEESTLTEIYSSDDPVIKDPKAIQKLGWTKMGAIYLDKQNVRLDVQRFKTVLEKALKLLQ